MAHFTYHPEVDKAHLRQGDIIQKSSEICSILEEIHPHYLKEDYKYFSILTQSCDLVRRSGATCKARYISIAAVRPFDIVIKREISNLQKEQIEQKGGICNRDKRSSLYSYIEKILNNNHPDYFYLHEDSKAYFPKSCCAFLRLSISIRTEDHYEKLLNAKLLELTEEFRAKLGWLVGNLFSRVGTRDWAPDYKPQEEFKGIINDILDKKVVWVEKGLIKGIKKYIKDNDISIPVLNQKDIKSITEKIILPTKEERKKNVVNTIKRALENSNVLLEGANIDKLMRKIESDPMFSSHIK